LGRWGTFKEIWIYPIEHWKEVSLMFIVTAVLLYVFIKTPYFRKDAKKMMQS
jgi:hypothetical protein